jgi:1-acyl-sn-glycerol-3-phosphate acyltransferase
MRSLGRRLKCAYRVAASVLLLVGFMGQAVFLHYRHVSDRKKRKALAQLVTGFCRRILAMLNVRVRIDYPDGQDPLPSKVILISNHLSFLDVFIVAAHFPAIFITSTELRDAFLLGWVSRLGGCLFVDRRNPRRLHHEMAAIRGVLADDLSVMFFPEATSSNGEQVLPFRTALFSIPLATGIPILPVVLNYQAVNGVYNDPASIQRNVLYYGEQTFFGQLWRVLNTQSIDIVLSFLPLESFSGHPVEKATRQARANSLHSRISSRYKPLVREPASL